jgi:hypothetical protein
MSVANAQPTPAHNEAQPAANLRSECNRRREHQRSGTGVPDVHRRQQHWFADCADEGCEIAGADSEVPTGHVHDENDCGNRQQKPKDDEAEEGGTAAAKDARGGEDR